MSEHSLDPEFVAHCQQALAPVSTKDGPITADRPLADLGLDSISMAELVIQLEDMLSGSNPKQCQRRAVTAYK